MLPVKIVSIATVFFTSFFLAYDTFTAVFVKHQLEPYFKHHPVHGINAAHTAEIIFVYLVMMAVVSGLMIIYACIAYTGGDQVSSEKKGVCQACCDFFASLFLCIVFLVIMVWTTIVARSWIGIFAKRGLEYEMSRSVVLFAMMILSIFLTVLRITWDISLFVRVLRDKNETESTPAVSANGPADGDNAV